MAIFSKNKKEEKGKKGVTTERDGDGAAHPLTAQKVQSDNGGIAIEDVLRRPHITEKASDLAERGVYVFEVDPRANKALVKRAVRIFYKVTPQKVRIINTPRKRVFVRGRYGVRSGIKKALVYLKEGESIEII